MTDFKKISGAISKRSETSGDSGTRVVLTIGPSANRFFLSYFKNDKFIRPEVLDTLDGLAEGNEGEFIYTEQTGKDGRTYRNVKGFVPIQHTREADEQKIMEHIEKTRGVDVKPQANRTDGDKKNRAFALAYAKDLYVALTGQRGFAFDDGAKKALFQLAEEMVMFLDGLPYPVSLIKDENVPF